MKPNFGIGKCKSPFNIAIICSLFLLVIFRCKMDSNRKIVDISGAYRLVPKETIGTSADSNFNKINIYTPDFYMYAQKNKLDSVTSFEIGTYTLNGEKLKQNIIFGSSGTTSYEPRNIIFDIKLVEGGDIQITKPANTVSSGGLPEKEYYDFIGNKSKSVIDGVWKQISTYAVTDKDTIWDRGTNFKILYDGYVIWGDYHINPATQKQDTYMGFGTFAMKGDSALEETYIKSNYESNEGKTFYIDVVFKNNNEFAQSILNKETGVRYVEVYQRLNSITK